MISKREPPLSIENSCSGWEEAPAIVLEERGVVRTAKISPVGRLGALSKGTNQEKLENRASEAEPREPVSLGKNSDLGFAVFLPSPFPHMRCGGERLGRELG